MTINVKHKQTGEWLIAHGAFMDNNEVKFVLYGSDKWSIDSANNYVPEYPENRNHNSNILNDPSQPGLFAPLTAPNNQIDLPDWAKRSDSSGGIPNVDITPYITTTESVDHNNTHFDPEAGNYQSSTDSGTANITVNNGSDCYPIKRRI